MSTINIPDETRYGITWWTRVEAGAERVAVTGYVFATIEAARMVAKAGLELHPATPGFVATYVPDESMDLGPDFNPELIDLLPFAPVAVADIETADEVVEYIRQPVVFGLLTKGGTAMVETAVAAADRNNVEVVGRALVAAMASDDWDGNPELVDVTGNEVMEEAIT